jgi:hypothetical protein
MPQPSYLASEVIDSIELQLMKLLFASVICLGLSSALFANVAVVPSLSHVTPTQRSMVKASPVISYISFPMQLKAQIPYPDPNSPYPPMLKAQIPYPDPNSPYPPMLKASIPYPDPNSPYPPMLTAQIPYPDPNSPYPPMLKAQIPYPDPNSPYPPMLR